MSYIAANNDYGLYEKSIHGILETPIEHLSFFHTQDITGVFGVSDEFGTMYCKCIQDEFPEELKKIRDGVYDTLLNEFHSIGKPPMFYSDILGRSINANTTRYIYHAFLIKKYMEQKFPGKALQVVEIGGGYGGLCFWLSKLAPLSIKTYEIFDLNTVLKLQKRCLEKWNVACSYSDNPFTWNKTDTTFVISNYGFSEFNELFQRVYTQTITSKSDGGFMVWNNWTGMIKFTENQMVMENERPDFPGCHNLFLYF
jgi:hypothetical protein